MKKGFVLTCEGKPFSALRHSQSDCKCTIGLCGWTEGLFAGLYPERCECGGVIHVEAPPLSGMGDPSWHPVAQCDKCGEEKWVSSP